MSQRGPDNPQPLDNVPILGWAVSEIAGLFGGGSPPPVLSPKDKRALEAAGYDVNRRGRARGPVVTSPTGQVYRGRQELKDLRALIRTGQLSGPSPADRPAPGATQATAAIPISVIIGRVLGRATPTRDQWETEYERRVRLWLKGKLKKPPKLRTVKRIAKRLAPVLGRVLKGAGAGARGGGYGAAIGAGIVIAQEILTEARQRSAGIPAWEDIRVTAPRLPVPPSSPPRSQAAPARRLPGRSTSASTRRTASPVLEEIRVTARRLPMPATVPSVPPIPGPVPPGPAPKPKWVQLLETASPLLRRPTTPPAPRARSVVNVSQVPALQTQPLTYFQGLGVPSTPRSKTCECKPKRKRSQPTCRNPVVRRTKRTVDGRQLQTVTREITCPPSSRKKPR